MRTARNKQRLHYMRRVMAAHGRAYMRYQFGTICRNITEEEKQGAGIHRAAKEMETRLEKEIYGDGD